MTAVNNFLETNGVPRRLIDQMNGTGSSEIYWLTQQDVKDVGRYPAWFEELILAKCKHRPGIWSDIDLILDKPKEYEKYHNCREGIILPELKSELKRLLN